VDFTTETPISLNEVAALFKVHRQTVGRWRDAGLECVWVGGVLYTSREALQRFTRPGKEKKKRKGVMAGRKKKHPKHERTPAVECGGCGDAATVQSAGGNEPGAGVVERRRERADGVELL
jgi:hypothetical protein